MRTAADGTADAATVRMQQENVHLRTAVERTAAELRHLRDSRRAEPDSAILAHRVRFGWSRVLQAFGSFLVVIADRNQTCVDVPMLPDAAAMANHVRAAEQAAQHAVADASALRSALSEADAINMDLRAQLRMWASTRDAAQNLTRQGIPLLFCFTQIYPDHPAALCCGLMCTLSRQGARLPFASNITVSSGGID